jgi:hypothetical protein
LQGERWSNNFFDAKIMNELLEEEHIPMNADKFATKDHVLE